jgi:hypothetical protein
VADCCAEVVAVGGVALEGADEALDVAEVEVGASDDLAYPGG